MEPEATAAETIAPGERNLAALAHLSGLAGYVIPLGGVIVPIIIMIVKKDSRTIASIAKQALLLNVAVFLALLLSILLWLTIILIPLAILGAIALGLIAIILPIVGALKAFDGIYYRYPVVGVSRA